MSPPALLRPGGPLSYLGELTGLVYRPTDDEALPVLDVGGVGDLEVGRPFRVVSWNVQYAATRRQHFFYDGGEAVHVPPEDCAEGLAGIVATLGALRPDVALLQELDRDSDRTGRSDQLAHLASRTRFGRWASATCHRSRFVPAPTARPLGRVDMHVAIGARFPLLGPRRLQLPLLVEPRVRKAFNLKRCLLTAAVPILGSRRRLHLAVTHLSAFSRGDGTLARQVAALRAWMEARERSGDPFVLGGDLNLLPPGDDPTRLGRDAAEYADHPNPIEALTPRFRSIVPPDRLLDPAARTYLPWGAPLADRVLDYVFVSEGIEVLEAGPVVSASPISDHHPLVATLRLL